MTEDEKPISSYQKGLNRLLEHKEKFEKIIIEYLVSVNSKYNSNMFPTPQIAKIMLSKLVMKKTQFPILHKVVRTILADWKDLGWCEYVTTTKSGRNRRTKIIYKFSKENFDFLKGKLISSSILEIEGEIKGDPNAPHDKIMKSRDNIVDDWMYEVQNEIDAIDFDNAEIEDVDKIENIDDE
jgi:hypothetical protein